MRAVCVVIFVLFLHVSLSAWAKPDCGTVCPAGSAFAKDGSVLELIQREQTGTGLMKAPGEKKNGRGRYYLAKGWEFYRLGDYKRAVSLFRKASRYKGLRREAELGIAYAYVKERRLREAASILEGLVEERFRVDETLPALVDVLLRMKDYKRAAYFAKRLGGERGKRLFLKIKGEIIRNRYTSARKRGDVNALISIVNDYLYELERCSFSDVFYNIAEFLNKRGYKGRAKSIYLKLIASCPNRFGMRIAVFYKLRNLFPFSRMYGIIEEELKRSSLPVSYRKKLVEMKLHLLKQRLLLVDRTSLEAERIAREILRIDPKDWSVWNYLAWWYYRHGMYEDARAIFYRLRRKFPKNERYALGLVYSLLKLNRIKSALDVLDGLDASDSALRRVKADIYMRLSVSAYERSDYSEAVAYLKRLLSIEPNNADARRLLAWSLYKQGRFSEALPIFLHLCRTRRDPAAAEATLGIYQRLGQEEKAFRFARDISELDGYRKVAADFFYSRGCPITASQIYTGNETCYYNAGGPWMEAFPYYAYKSGSSGISRLKQVVFPIRFSFSTRYGKSWSFFIASKKLYSGHAPSHPYVGSYYRGVKRHSLMTSVSVVALGVSWDKEGPVRYGFDFGLTPLGGPVPPAVTFEVRVGGRNWNVNLHQRPVEESILSYVGLRDPYSGKGWGRVLRTGLEGELVFPFSPCWLSVRGGLDYYWGRDVWRNYALFGTVAFGKTISRPDSRVSFGVFATGKHFWRNTDYFTYGHGGYFSPQYFFMAGPIARVKSRLCRTLLLDARVSAGYLYFHTEDAPKYPLSGGLGRYGKDDFSGLGYSARVRVLKLLGRHLALGCFVGFNRSSNYREYIFGVTIKLFFTPRLRLL